MIVVDSSLWLDHFRGLPSLASGLLDGLLSSGTEIAVTDVIYMELLRGLRDEREVDVLRALLRQSTDCMIAAVCVREGLRLMTQTVDTAGE